VAQFSVSEVAQFSVSLDSGIGIQAMNRWLALVTLC
jgi:hypothetical protein